MSFAGSYGDPYASHMQQHGLRAGASAMVRSSSATRRGEGGGGGGASRPVHSGPAAAAATSAGGSRYAIGASPYSLGMAAPSSYSVNRIRDVSDPNSAAARAARTHAAYGSSPPMAQGRSRVLEAGHGAAVRSSSASSRPSSSIGMNPAAAAKRSASPSSALRRVAAPDVGSYAPHRASSTAPKQGSFGGLAPVPSLMPVKPSVMPTRTAANGMGSLRMPSSGGHGQPVRAFAQAPPPSNGNGSSPVQPTVAPQHSQLAAHLALLKQRRPAAGTVEYTHAADYPPPPAHRRSPSVERRAVHSFEQHPTTAASSSSAIVAPAPAPGSRRTSLSGAPGGTTLLEDARAMHRQKLAQQALQQQQQEHRRSDSSPAHSPPSPSSLSASPYSSALSSPPMHRPLSTLHHTPPSPPAHQQPQLQAAGTSAHSYSPSYSSPSQVSRASPAPSHHTPTRTEAPASSSYAYASPYVAPRALFAAPSPELVSYTPSSSPPSPTVQQGQSHAHGGAGAAHARMASITQHLNPQAHGHGAGLSDAGRRTSLHAQTHSPPGVTPPRFHTQPLSVAPVAAASPHLSPSLSSLHIRVPSTGTTGPRTPLSSSHSPAASEEVLSDDVEDDDEEEEVHERRLVANSRRTSVDFERRSSRGGIGETVAAGVGGVMRTSPPPRPMSLPASRSQGGGSNPGHGGSGSSGHAAVPRLRALVGLQNMGNTCYLNSTLQCLLSTPIFLPYFATGAYRADVNPRSLARTRGALAYALGELAGRMVRGPDHSVDRPSDVKRAIAVIDSKFHGFGQHDSHELARVLLAALHDELNRVRVPPPYEEIKDADTDSIATRAHRWWTNHTERNQSVVMDCFAGQLQSSLVCQTCGNKSEAFDPFLDLSLPIPKEPAKRGGSGGMSGLMQRFSLSSNPASAAQPVAVSRCTLLDCFREFTREELLQGQEQVYCRRCKSHRDQSKRLHVYRWPRMLLVQLKRFSYGGYSRAKINTDVEFDAQLDLRDLAKGAGAVGEQGQTPPLYDLYAVSSHSGTSSGGHYIAHAKVADSPHAPFYTFNDGVVHAETAGVAACKGPSAYLLFYRRRE